MSDDPMPADGSDDESAPPPESDAAGSGAAASDQPPAEPADEPQSDAAGANAAPTEPADQPQDGPAVDEPSNGNATTTNVTYAIGVPGQHPRLLFTTTDPDQAQMQEQSGEVCFAVQVIPAEPYAITADGTALETVAPQLVDVQRTARLAARAVYEQKVAFYQSSVGLIQTDEASQGFLTAEFVNGFFFFQPNDGTGPGNDATSYQMRWRLADNSFSPPFANLQDFGQFVKAALGFGARCLQAYWAVVDQIAAAQDNDAVAAVDLTAGYPTS